MPQPATQQIALRHGMPEHTRYVIDPTQDPGLAQTQENADLITSAGLEIATYFGDDPKVTIATSHNRRAVDTALAIKEHPSVSPFVTGDPIIDFDLSEQAYYRSSSELDRSLALFAITHRLAETAFKGANGGTPYLILVSHEPVIRHLARMHGKDPNLDYMAVNRL